MHRWFAALIVAAVLGVGAVQPGAAQTCADFGSQKAAQQQLEQNGDPTGQLDPDLNGFACEQHSFEAAGATTQAQEAPDDGAVVDQPEAISNQITIDDSGPDTSDTASGESGVTVANNPGDEAVTSDDGSGNTATTEGTDEAADEGGAEEPVATDDGSASAAEAGDAAAAEDEAGAVAEAGDAVAVAENTGSGEAHMEEQKPVALPNTGVGTTAGPAAGTTALLLLGLLAGVALLAARRFGRA